MTLKEFIRKYDPVDGYYKNNPIKYIETFIVKDNMILTLNVKDMNFRYQKDDLSLILKTMDSSCAVFSFSNQFFNSSMIEAGNTYILTKDEVTLKFTINI